MQWSVTSQETGSRLGPGESAFHQRIMTGPPIEPVLFCSLASVVCHYRSRLSSYVTLQGTWAVGRPTLHGGPVRLRPVRATPCFE